MKEIRDNLKTLKKNFPINKATTKALICAGAFDDFEENRFKLLNEYLGSYSKKELTAVDQELLDEISNKDYGRMEKLALEMKYFSYYLSEHPLSQYKEHIDLESLQNKQEVEFVCLIKNSEFLKFKSGKKKGEKYRVITVELEDSRTVKVKVWESYLEEQFGYLLTAPTEKNKLKARKIKGKVNMWQGNVAIDFISCVMIPLDEEDKAIQQYYESINNNEIVLEEQRFVPVDFPKFNL